MTPIGIITGGVARVLLFFFVAITSAAKEMEMDVTPDIHPIEPTGILFFGYGSDGPTAEHYLEQAVTSARRIKLLNPTTNITVVANPGVTLAQMDGVFDMVINIDEEYLYEGKEQAWGPRGVSRQWMTRLEYLSRSPYEVTLALDSQALCCSTDVNDVLNELRWEEFDVAFAVQGPKMLGPHNWAIMYRMNFNTRRMFKRWQSLQVDYARSGSDQLTLHMAVGSLMLQGKLNVGVLSESVAMATVPYARGAPEYPKTSTLIDPRPVHFVHYDAESREDEETTCEKLNRESDKARVVVLPTYFKRNSEGRRIENIYELVYSEEELAKAINEAREGMEYFRGLDWGNASGKWGHVATPWEHHYLNCLEDLAKDVNLGVRHIYHDPEDLWDVSHFATEFADDNLDWPNE